MSRKRFYLGAKFVLCSLFILMVVCFSPLTITKTHASSGHPYGVTILAKDWVISSNASDTGADLNNLGVKWVRIQANEQDIENQQNDTYTWSTSNYDLVKVIADAVQHNLQVDFPLQFAEPGKQPDPEDFSSTGCTSTPTGSAMSDYGVAVANKFGTELSAIEIGNEEYSPGRFNWTGSCGDPATAASTYTQVVKTAYPAIKAVFSGKVGMYGITSYVGQLPNLQTYLSDLYGDGIAPYIDYNNFHFYTGDGTGPAPGPIASNPTLQQVINAFLAAEQIKGVTIPIWLTEFGWQTAVNSNCTSLNNVSQQTQANYTAGITNPPSSVVDIMRTDSQSEDTNHAFLYTVESGYDCHSIDPVNSGQPLCQNSTGPYCQYLAYTQLKSYISTYPYWP